MPLSLKARPLGCRSLILILTIGLIGMMGLAAPPSGQAPLDNNPEDERESYQGREDLDPGQIETDAERGDADFNRLEFGIAGGGEYFGWTDLDGDGREAELVVGDPTLSAADVRLADADGDGDTEVVWVGTRGADIDGNDKIVLDEAGAIVGMIDVDSDGNTEIIVQDTSRVLGEFHHEGFGINRAADDPREVLWVGILGENKRGRAATVIGFDDLDGDGESEVELQDIRTSGSPPFDQFIDVDDDGDGDIVIRIPN